MPTSILGTDVQTVLSQASVTSFKNVHPGNQTIKILHHFHRLKIGAIS